MALTKLKVVRDDAPIGSSIRRLLTQHNLVVAEMRVIAVALDADAGANIDNDYASTLDADVLRLLSSAGTNTTIAA
jgi:hypothetical protein